MDKTETQFNISESAEIAGISRMTLNRHIKAGKITPQLDSDGNKYLDISQLIQTYGNDINLDKVPGYDTPKKDVTRNKLQHDTSATVTPSNDVEIALLKQKLEILEKERAEERKRFEEQIDFLKDQLSDEKEERKKVNAILTDQRKESEKVITAQSKGTDETIKKIQRQNRRIWQELQAEKNKTLWQRVIGK